MGVFEFPEKEVTLTRINPLFSIEDIKKNTGFEFKISENLREMSLVNEKIENLIDRLDPKKLRDLEIKERRLEVLKNFE